MGREGRRESSKSGTGKGAGRENTTARKIKKVKESEHKESTRN